MPDNNEAALARLAALAQTPYEDLVTAAEYRSTLVEGELVGESIRKVNARLTRALKPAK